ncbi:MAG: 4-carboxymuconolactone decarboxylase [Verrucomicrobia bacterium]|nr:4-carboxymuconolactone decarboxylase [Verrucomicrobiota bacterium]MBV9272470.1 4-carboxymuconolactone decarboxylase [Verrucomicrobiota bacterium]
MEDSERYKKGLEIRREVLGENYVDQAQAKVNEFNSSFQELITRYAWGEIWGRGGLTRRERSLITLAMLVALNREAEFRLHIQAAFRNGVTVAELRELLLHSGIYCGLPAANAAMRAAEEVMSETKGGPGSS